MRKLDANEDLLIGRSAKSGKLRHYDGAAHLLPIAPTVRQEHWHDLSNLLLLDDCSVFCIDLRGENARVRATEGKVWCLDPLGV